MSSSIEITSTEERIRPKNSEVNRLFGDNSLLLKLTDWNPSFGGHEGFCEDYAFKLSGFQTLLIFHIIELVNTI